MSIRQVDNASAGDERSRAIRKIPGAGANARQGTGDECHEAMLRHNERMRCMARPGPGMPSAGGSGGENGGRNGGAYGGAHGDADGAERGSGVGDIIYGAIAIARFIFDDYRERGPKKCRRRVFHLWNHYRDRKEQAGFFKLKGTLCLSKSQWRRFHGLD